MSSTPLNPAVPTRPPTSTRRAVLNTMKGSAGNLVGFYDDVYVYTVFAVTLVMRPVGSWFFVRYADRRGRKAALMFSITVMSTCSFVVAIMPTRTSSVGGRR